jgi:hypothetical protein
LEPCLFGSLGAEIESSRETRLDSGVLPLPEEDLRREPERDPDCERPFDFDEELREPPERLLLLDRDFRWGIRPSLLLDRSVNP